MYLLYIFSGSALLVTGRCGRYGKKKNKRWFVAFAL